LGAQVYGVEFYGKVGFNISEDREHNEFSAMTKGDFNGDGKEEVAVIHIHNNGDGRLIILEWSEEWKKFVPVVPPKYMEYWVNVSQCWIEKGEFDTTVAGEEIVVVVETQAGASEGNYWCILFYSIIGDTILGVNYERSQGILLPPVVGNMDDDKIEEVIVGFTAIDSAAWDSAGKLIEERIDNPIAIQPLFKPCFYLYNNPIERTRYELNDKGILGFIGIIKNLGENYADVIGGVTVVDYSVVNEFFNQLWDFLEGVDKKGMVRSGIMWGKSMKGIVRGGMVRGEKVSYNEKDYYNVEEIVKWEEEEVTPPTLTGEVLTPQIVMMEMKKKGKKFIPIPHHGLCIDGVVHDFNKDENQDVVMNVVNLNINEVNSLIRGFEWVKVKERKVHKLLDTLGGPLSMDSSCFVMPTRVPHSLNFFPFIQRLVFVDGKSGERMNVSEVDGFPYPWISYIELEQDSSGVFTVTNTMDVDKLNQFLKEVDTIYREARSYLPDSIQWWCERGPMIPERLFNSYATYVSLTELLSYGVGNGWIVGHALSGGKVFLLEDLLNYEDLNANIEKWNKEYEVYHKEWLSWAAESLANYCRVWDSCAALHNKWATAYYDSIQSGGERPPYPDIAFPKYPGGEPTLETSEYEGEMYSIEAKYYERGTELWKGMREGRMGCLTSQEGIEMDLDGDEHMDFVFIRYDYPDPKVEDTLGERTSLYVYRSKPFGVREKVVPKSMRIVWIKPNPFRTTNLLELAIPRKEKVEVKVYSRDGRLVKVLMNEEKEEGKYFIGWDGTDEKGRKVGNGVYMIKVRVGKVEEVKKVVLMR
jgi:hypothetical protein